MVQHQSYCLVVVLLDGGMELQLLLRTIAVGLLALQCSVLSVVFGLPAERNAAADRFYKATDDDRSDDYYDYDEEEKRALLVR